MNANYFNRILKRITIKYSVFFSFKQQQFDLNDDCMEMIFIFV